LLFSIYVSDPFRWQEWGGVVFGPGVGWSAFGGAAS